MFSVYYRMRVDTLGILKCKRREQTDNATAQHRIDEETKKICKAND